MIDKDDKIFLLCFAGLTMTGMISMLSFDETVISIIILIIMAIVMGGILYILFSKDSNNK